MGCTRTDVGEAGVRKPAVLPLATAAAMVLVVGVGVPLARWLERPPVLPEEAGLTGEVWVMPAADVRGFLADHGAPTTGTLLDQGAVVVGRVSWTARPTGDGSRLTVLLGDARGGAGYVEEVLGGAEDVSLGNGSMWRRTVESHDWLRGSRPVQLEGGWTDYGMFASVPASTTGDVWFLGKVVDVPLVGHVLTSKPDASPVVGIALTTGDRVWWVRRVASA